MNKSSFIVLFVIVQLVSITITSVVSASSLENLERERAALLNTLLSPDITVKSRMAKVQRIKHRLASMEEMVLRDDRLVEKSDYLVKRALANYDLTFLVHASAEKDQKVIAHWLNSLDLNSQTILNAHIGSR